MAAAKKAAPRRKKVTRKTAVRKEKALVADGKIITNALEFRKAGLTWQEISDQVGIPVPTLWKKVHKYLDSLPEEPAKEMRKLHYERYNFILSRLWPAVISGDTSSVNQAVNVMGRIERLYGLEAPTRSESVNVNVDPSKLVIGGTEDDYINGMAGMAAQIDPALLAKIPPHLRDNVIDTKESIDTD